MRLQLQTMEGSETVNGNMDTTFDRIVNDATHPKTPAAERLTTWKEKIDVSIRKSRKVRGGNYIQLSTVDEQGHPRCRTVVFRGFVEIPAASAPRGNARRLALKMITDSRSSKVPQINRDNRCEVVWWFSKSSEQYRIAGDIVLVSAEGRSGTEAGEKKEKDATDIELLRLRRQQWGNLSDKAREQFFWQQPGQTHRTQTQTLNQGQGRGQGRGQGQAGSVSGEGNGSVPAG